MVRVEMRDDHAAHRAPGKQRADQRLPEIAHAVLVQPAIDDGPSVPVFQQVEVDVVEHEGQRHPHPPDSFGHLPRRAFRRRLVIGVLDDDGAHWPVSASRASRAATRASSRSCSMRAFLRHLLHGLEILAPHKVHRIEQLLQPVADYRLHFVANGARRAGCARGHAGQVVQDTFSGLHGFDSGHSFSTAPTGWAMK